QGLFDVIAGLPVADPGVEPPLVVLGVLAREDGELGFEAVLEGIEAGAVLAFGGPGTGALAAIAAADLGALGGGFVHRGVPPAWVEAAEGRLRRALVTTGPNQVGGVSVPTLHPRTIFKPPPPVA